MTLIEIVGFTSTGKTFNIAYALTKKEDNSHYLFVVKRLERLYMHVGRKPTAIVTDRELTLINAVNDIFGDSVKHLLCWVHIRNNIEAYALTAIKLKDTADDFANKCWGLFMSNTEESYERRLKQLKDNWDKGGDGLVSYMENTWLNPYKKNIVRAWTDHHLHFFTRTTNR